MSTRDLLSFRETSRFGPRCRICCGRMPKMSQANSWPDRPATTNNPKPTLPHSYGATANFTKSQAAATSWNLRQLTSQGKPSHLLYNLGFRPGPGRAPAGLRPGPGQTKPHTKRTLLETPRAKSFPAGRLVRNVRAFKISRCYHRRSSLVVDLETALDLARSFGIPELAQLSLADVEDAIA
jgi:hypothetical protein